MSCEFERQGHSTACYKKLRIIVSSFKDAHEYMYKETVYKSPVYI